MRYGADFPKAGYELENDGEPPLTHPTGVAHLKTFVGLSGRETQQSVTGVGFHSSTQPTLIAPF
ncbi:MAG: hypothetical protein F6K55_02380 [Moorea sp. SIO4A3]|nr:hypothetical protein [Moorena sp. SIO4A3]